MREPFLDVIRRVYDGEHGACIEVRPSEAGGGVEVKVTGKSEEYFGKADLIMTAAQARLLGKALLDAAEENE